MHPILPIAALAGAFFLFGRKGKRKSKALPEATRPVPNAGYGSLFVGGDLPNIISAKTGELFTIRLTSSLATGYNWKLVSTPPQNELELVDKDGNALQALVSGSPSFIESISSGGAGAAEDHFYFIFKALKAGSGSVVFHLDPPGSNLPPEQVVEIKVEITDN